jgi:RND family efflux transporter MFP subunit
MRAAGLVAAEGGEAADGRQDRGRDDVRVVADAVRSVPLSDVVTVIGSARGVQAVDLSFPITGRITSLTVAPGDRVEAGAVIAELDSGAARLSVDRARLVLEDARRTVDRLDQLAQTGTATALQRQDAELALRTAELELEIAERALAEHRLVAPISGFVGLIEPQPGDILSTATVLTRIEDRSSLVVDFRLPERLAPMVGLGTSVTATAISQPGSATLGHVIAVDNRVDEASRTLRVQAEIENRDDRLRSGMAFRIDLAFPGVEHPAIDPLSIQWGSDGAFVWVVREARAERLPIRILQRNEDHVLVEADILPGDLIVTEGVHLLRPGSDVAVTPPRS